MSRFYQRLFAGPILSKTERKERALCDAARRGKLSVVQRLVGSGVNIDGFGGENIPQGERLSALMIAIDCDHEEMVDYLISNGANVNFSNSQEDVLLVALRKGNSRIVGQLIGLGVNINGIVVQRPTLIVEVAAGRGENVELLLAGGANVNISAPNSLKTPLHFAAENGFVSLIHQLMDNGATASINTIDENGFTPLMLAIQNDQENAVDCLIANNADVNIANELGYSALLLASHLGQLSTVQVLLNNGAKLDQLTLAGTNVLHEAISSSEVEVPLCLLRQDIPSSLLAQQERNTRRTPLHFACLFQQTEVVEALIAKGADPTIKDKRERLPDDYLQTAIEL